MDRKIDILDLVNVNGERQVVTCVDDNHQIVSSMPIKEFIEHNLIVTVDGVRMSLSDYLNTEIDIIVKRGGLCGWQPKISL